MEIIRKAVQGPHKFKVKRSFMLLGRDLQIGEEIELKEPEATAMVKIGKVTPADLPPIGEYIALQKFTLPGRDAKFSCEKMERVSIRASDALQLMLAGSILPVSESQWRPNGRKLKTDRTTTRAGRRGK